MMQQTPVLARLICDDDPMDGRQADREGRDATDRDRAPPPSETPPAPAAQESPKVESNPNEAGKLSSLHKKEQTSRNLTRRRIVHIFEEDKEDVLFSLSI